MALTPKYVGYLLLGYSIGLVYAFFVTAGNLIRWALKGKEFWYVKERTAPPKCLNDPVYGRHSFIKVNKVKLHYVENGDSSKPLMLFVHGFPEFWFGWRHQMKHFAKTHWVVAFDMRGYGDSDKPGKISDYAIDHLVQDVVGLVRGLGREKCILVAHDWGGIVAWNVAMSAPQVVEKLVIANAPHPGDFGIVTKSVKQFFKSWYVFLFQIPFVAETSQHTNDTEIFDKLLLNSKGQLKLSDDEVEAYKYTYNSRESWKYPINYYRANLSLAALLEEPEYPKIKAPTLIIWGEKDVALSNFFPEMAKDRVNNLTVVMVPEATHFVQEDRPEEFNAALAKFIQ